jgi:tetratricopeptide (TPR) repeat protein
LYLSVFAGLAALPPAAQALTPRQPPSPPSPSSAQAQAPAAAPAAADPDVLYAQREDLAKARQAVDLWAQRLKQNPKDAEAAWKLARARYWLGGHGPDPTRRQDLEAGMEAARAAITLDPKRPEGHFWLAANMGELAESYGLRAGIRYRKPIKQSLEEVLRLDPAFQAGSADRALGRWYFKVPGLFGGSNEQSEAHLRKSLTYDPNSTASHFFLAETLLDMGRKADARAELQKVLEVPIDPDWGPEDREFKQKAKALLGKIGG